MTFLYALRYFQVVSVVPLLFLAGFVITVAAAAMRLTSDPSAVVEALTPVLLLQLFAASSGFRFPARRGHYDLLLTSGTPRWQIALAHCLASITPGIVSWLCVAMLELAASHGAHFTAAATGTCAAFVGSSLLAWGAAVFSSRAAAAIGWLLVMTIPPVARLVSPLRLLGMTAAGSDHFVLASTFAGALIPFVTGLVCIIRDATPLEASQ